MRKFTIRLLAFSIPAFFLLIVTITYYCISKSTTDTKLNEAAKHQLILMGDSQIQRLNGALLAENSKNLASSAEHYYFTYQKLLSLVEQNQYKIEQLLLGVSIHSFAPVYNRLFDLQFPEGKKSLQRYLYFIRPLDGSSFLSNNFGVESIKFLLAGVYAKPEWGGFKESNNTNPTDAVINKTFDMHYSIKQDEEKFSYSQQAYLYKIDSLCSKYNIELTLISTPYHTKYKDKVDPEYMEFFSETLMNLNHRNHLNFIEDSILPDLMSDANHLNKQGAVKYARKIQKELKIREKSH